MMRKFSLEIRTSAGVQLEKSVPEVLLYCSSVPHSNFPLPFVRTSRRVSLAFPNYKLPLICNPLGIPQLQVAF